MGESPHPTPISTSTSTPLPRQRIRTLLPNLHLGFYLPGPQNSLTDIRGLLVSTQSIHRPGPNPVHTGLTTIIPRASIFSSACHAGIHRFNGAGEMTGSHWIAETGLLNTPICITGTFSVGGVWDGMMKHLSAAFNGTSGEWFALPVVAETFDGYLSDPAAFAIGPAEVAKGIKMASSAAVEEGCTGGGTGMICHHFKGGTGSSSRVVDGWTVGALVQANYGAKRDLRIAGVPVGRLLMEDEGKKGEVKEEKLPDGSIIVVLATDAPLHPVQLQRLAARATTGIARVGGNGANSSGDIFLAFSTGNEIPVFGDGLDESKTHVNKLKSVDDRTITGLFDAAAEAVEESIYNALCCAETTHGREGRTIEALPLDKLKQIMEKYT